MDYRHTAIDTLTDFAEEHPNMTFGDMLYSALLPRFIGFKLKNTKELRKITDKNFYEAIEKAKKYEHEN